MARGRLEGEVAVPHGLAVAAAVLARVVVVLGSLVLIGYALGKLLLVVLPVIVALLLATVMVPLAHRLRDRGLHERAAALIVVLATVVLLGVLLVLIVPPFVSQLGEVGTSAEEGTRKVGKLLAPLGSPRRRSTRPSTRASRISRAAEARSPGAPRRERAPL